MLRVSDAKQRDVGHGKVRIDNETLEKLKIAPGDFVEVHGLRMTVAVAWLPYPEDRGQKIVRMDGLLRKNAGITIDGIVEIKKATVNDSQTIVFAPADVHLKIDQEFLNFVKRRFMDQAFVQGDMTLISIYGSAVPLMAMSTVPNGPVKITGSTIVQVVSEPAPDPNYLAPFPLDLVLMPEKLPLKIRTDRTLGTRKYIQLAPEYVREVLETYENWKERFGVPEKLKMLMMLLRREASR